MPLKVDPTNSSEPLIEFSRPFKFDKVGRGTPYHLQISASDDEKKALSKRFGIESILKLEADFTIERNLEEGSPHPHSNSHMRKSSRLPERTSSRGHGSQNFQSEGTVSATIVRDQKNDSENLVENTAPIQLKFPIKLHLIEGEESESASFIDWHDDLDNEFDLEFYKNSEIDFGEIVSQYLSLELILPQLPLEQYSVEDQLPTEEELSLTPDITHEKASPFDVLKMLKK